MRLFLPALFLLAFLPFDGVVFGQSQTAEAKKSTVRFATFNISFNRKTEGLLKKKLATGKGLNFARIAEIIQRVNPDVILLNEFDYDEAGQGVADFESKFLAVGQNGQPPIKFEYRYLATSNTGVDSGIDLDGDGETGTPNDAFGYGVFPGQYAMVVLSKFPIQKDQVRTFQKFLWKDMPDAAWPIVPETDKPFYSDEAVEVFRLSSKNHCDVPIDVDGKTIHLLASHPTPPAFDGDEDRNGKRNHDEIRLFADYIGNQCDYLYDDNGKKGGLAKDSNFVIVGDQNADPNDGDSHGGAAKLIIDHPLVNSSFTPQSTGGAQYSKDQGGLNDSHTGDPLQDTADFGDHNVGNLRIDYCLPSKTLKITGSGVFWPAPGEEGADLVKATDHRLVWIDIEK